MPNPDGRAEAALTVLRGASVGHVADEQGVSPQVVLEWVDLFCAGGEARLAELTETGELAGDEGVAVDNTAVIEPEDEPIDPLDLAAMLEAASGEIVDKDSEPDKTE